LIIDKTLFLREEIIGQDGLKCQWNIGIRIVEVSMFVGCELCLLQIEMLYESGKYEKQQYRKKCLLSSPMSQDKTNINISLTQQKPSFFDGI